MSDKHFGLGRSAEQNLVSQGVGVQSLPLATPLPQQECSLRLGGGSQGGRPSARSNGNNGTMEQGSISSMLSSPPANHSPLTGATSTPTGRKRKASSQDIVTLRRKVAENEMLRIRRYQTQYGEKCATQCFFQNNGQPSDYSSWRTRLPPVPLVTFFRVNKLNQEDENEDLYTLLRNSSQANISPIGRSPIDGTCRLTSPSNLVSSNQVLDKRLTTTKPLKSSISVHKSTISKQELPLENSTAASSQEQIVERAKQEAYVMQRIGELQRDGLWAEKRLPKVQELPRPKAHWDYLLEEMVWLAADFAQERKWKKAAAKKCARMVQKYFQEKEQNAQKAVKAKEIQLKRIASFMAKEVKLFWSNVEKLVEFKQQTRLEEKRKKALDQHLSFIVDQTEKYSSLVAESMNTSVLSSRQTSPKHHSDIEFEPQEDSDDDEETIAKEEALSKEDEEADEIQALQRESELPLEDLLSDYLNHRDSLPEAPSSSNSSHDGENNDDVYRGSDKDSSDDEETIQEQEEVEGSVNHKEELSELEADNNLSIDDLKEKYKVETDSVQKKLPKVECDGAKVNEENNNKEGEERDDDDDDEEDDSDDEDEEEDEEMDIGSEGGDEEETALKSLFKEEKKESCSSKDQEINDVAAIAESLQPKGNTLSSTNVVTKVPFLLKHKLREYQHIGLDWLVTMYERNLNGILADEMGLGKTIQTISLLAHLACVKGNWGPHLIVVPTSVMLNWEMEFKKWSPAFKILTYYGSIKERRLKRIGWTKPNAFHVCITSYKLIIQDHQSFRRKKWKYLILDEAQNIKNFKSQRWQLLLNFQTQRRLLLTGTPLQNNLMELWSLMHFLMPSVFESHREFKEWFSNPVTGMIEGNSEYNETIIKRLHKVLRPFLLRRLKSEVETQMPKKYEHIVMCRLSNRQRYLYDDFMSRAKTRETLATGNLLSVINVLMQLRKVCNHPNLFEVRPTVSPFQMERLCITTASLVTSVLDYNPFKHVNLSCLNLMLVELEWWLLAFVAHRARRYKTSSKFIQEIDSAPPDLPKCPKGKIKISVQRRNSSAQSAQVTSPLKPSFVQVPGGNNHRIITTVGNTKVGTSPIIKALVSQTGAATPNQGVTLRLANPAGGQLQNYFQLVQQQGGVKAISVAPVGGQVVKQEGGAVQAARLVPQIAQIVSTPSGKQLLLSPQQVQPGAATTVVRAASGQRVTVVSKQSGAMARLVTPAHINSTLRPMVRVPPLNISNPIQSFVVSNSGGGGSSDTVTFAAASVNSTAVSNSSPSPTKSSIVTRQTAQSTTSEKQQDKPPNPFADLKDDRIENIRRVRRKEKLQLLNKINEARCQLLPIYGVDVIDSLKLEDKFEKSNWMWTGSMLCKMVNRGPAYYWHQSESLNSLIYSVEDRVHQLEDVFSRFVMYVPAVSAGLPCLSVSHPPVWKIERDKRLVQEVERLVKPMDRLMHPVSSAMATQFPDPRLIQYDCGKLQSLNHLLRHLKTNHHRALIFTQMTRMLDVLEAFLTHHGHIYLRLDGTTKVEQRQVLMERFNNDRRIFCFILSTRSGGVGVNLTGADTVIFYDSDWNPTMDAQAQDRCHRIGQTRDVHIYRLISEMTVEENILKKANQKRMLGDLAIEGGNFTTAYFKSTTIQDLFNVDVSENDPSRRMAEVLHKDSDKKTPSEEAEDNKTATAALESALAQAEDETDVAAARVATAEAAAELAEFDETIPIENQESQEQLSKAELELQALVQQLSGVEKYAMRFIEEMDSSWAAEQLAAAEAQLEEQKKEWEANHAAREREERKRKASVSSWGDEDEAVTYSGCDARNQEWISSTGSQMPMWCPPTPPQDDSDVYIDPALCLLYEQNVIPESQLPPAYIKKERKRARLDANLIESRLQTNKMRQKEETLLHAPRSLFDRPTPALMRMRQELRLQRHRGLMRPNQVPNLLKPPLPVKPLPQPEHVPDWVIHEDWTILQAVQQVQEMTLNLVVLSPGHTPNWDMVADMVNMSSRTYRSPKQCRNRYESVIIPREEGKLILDSPKKQKKNKTLYKLPQMKGGRPLRTSQLFQQDNNSSMTQVMNARFDAIRSVSNRRAPTVKPLLVDPAMKNPKHAEVLAESQIDYEAPLTPMEVAAKRADRIAKEKLAHQGGISSEQQLAVIRQQQLSNIVKSSAGSASGSVTPRQLTTLTVQEMVATVGGNRTVVSTSPSAANQKQTLAQPSSPVTSAPTSPSTQAAAKGTKTISAAQLALYRQQHAVLRQQHLKLLTRNQQATTPPPKVSIAVTSPNASTPRIQQVKSGSIGRPVPEEMVALLKRQQGAKVATTSSPSGSLTTQILTGLQVKALNSGNKAVSPQQIRQLSLQQQLIAAAVAQQRSGKLPQQKVTQISQVSGKAGTGTQLIVQSGQKSLATTMTVQQIQQVMKQVQPQHVVVTPGRGTLPGTVSLEPTGRQVLATTLKPNQGQPAILTQVSAVLGGGQPITVRQPVRIQAPSSSTPLVAVASPTLITIPTTTSSTSDNPSCRGVPNFNFP